MRMTPVDDVTNEEILRVMVGSFVQCNLHKYVGIVVAVSYAFWCVTAYEPELYIHAAVHRNTFLF